MKSKYITIPTTVNFKEVLAEESLSPSDFIELNMKNNNFKLLKDVIKIPVKGGREVGSKEYIQKSNKYFIRTKSLVEGYYLLDITSESVVPIRPQVFKKLNLRKGDILLSKDSNIGEVAILDRDLPDYTLSGGLKILKPLKHLYYVFAFLKNDFFKNQIIIMSSRGATIKHAKNVWLDAKIPFPNKNSDKTIEFLETLVKARIKKETEIQYKYKLAMSSIREELETSQKNEKYSHNKPSINDLKKNSRLDAGIFCEEYKQEQFLIKNYIHGCKDIFSYGFDFKRGQNLQVSQIGKSIYSDEPKKGFYKLIRPVNLSDYGIIYDYEYLGNKNELQTINEGEIIFSAEGTIGKFCVFLDVNNKTITNIHGITIYKTKNKDDIESIFLGLFLSYLRKVGVLDYISVGGQGGSLAQQYWHHINIPKFPRKIKEEISKLYFANVNHDEKLTLENFEKKDEKITKKSGIYELNKQINKLQKKIDEIIQLIADDYSVEISFDFLK